MARFAPDAEALLHSRDLIIQGEFPFRRVLLLALCHAPLAPVRGGDPYCGWCSENTAEPLRVRVYAEAGPRHPQCFAEEFILMGDALDALFQPPEHYVPAGRDIPEQEAEHDHRGARQRGDLLRDHEPGTGDPI